MKSISGFLKKKNAKIHKVYFKKNHQLLIFQILIENGININISSYYKILLKRETFQFITPLFKYFKFVKQFSHIRPQTGLQKT